MGHRIFIAINLPEKIKKELSSFQERWPDLPCRWTKKENLHITLSFLGYLRDDQLSEILKITKEVAQRHQPFSIKLNRICYDSLFDNQFSKERARKMPPRMVWVEVEKCAELENLQKDLESSLFSSNKELKIEKRPYTPHITLGRIRQWELRQIEPEERPEINEEINLIFGVNSIEIMESKLKRIRPEYFVLESFELGK